MSFACLRSSRRAAPIAAGIVLLFAGPTLAEEQLSVEVDARVELMSVIFRLAGHPEYNMTNSQSPYSRDVEARFGEFRAHPAVQKARALRGSHGVTYDAVMSMAVHINNTTALREKYPFDKHPPRLDERWTVEDAREFLEHARDFVKATEFNDFFDEHTPYYEVAQERLSEQLAKHTYRAWFDKFFGARPTATFTVIPGLLIGGQNYGVGMRYPTGRETISPVLGAWNWDDEGYPVYGDDYHALIVHEFCHSYTNSLVLDREDDLRAAGERIFRHCAETMRRQNYGTWQTMMCESLVRASVVRYLADNDSKVEARREADRQVELGFLWVPKLADLWEIYAADREKYKTPEEFMPRVVAFFNEYVDTYEQEIQRFPKVVSITPANGASDVDPDTAAIVVVFDRAMADQSWSVVGGGDHFPEIVGKISYNASHKVLTVPVRLKSNWEYFYGLNSVSFKNFRSADGVPLEPVSVSFKTAAK